MTKDSFFVTASKLAVGQMINITTHHDKVRPELFTAFSLVNLLLVYGCGHVVVSERLRTLVQAFLLYYKTLKP